ncbi:DUF3575 domain-containing protein [Ornithobacterium rhinotracheale]|uniref:DUF3575 domain-containing protein n=1 Tax=Ornithobacterium rhinotracheale TaxID=28251 RepID=UPI001FF0FD3A|nr:DUF3575 domain-containing protein [Ornithobacterium rhinotracheale]MCK0204405.1 DUF3575 domain-containing protein [Ornithobacterium rhinotracheale]
MKSKLLLGALLAFGSLSAQVQQSTELPVSKKNVVKTNLLAYAFPNFNVTYERVFTKKFSLAAVVGYTPAFKPNNYVSINNNNDVDISSVSISNFSFTLEPRFYLGKGYSQGFYLSPYYRYSKLSLEKFSVSESKGNAKVDISGDLSANSLGLMIGKQWFLGQKKNWVLDWTIIGVHAGFSAGNLSGKSNQTLSAQEQADIKKDLEDVSLDFVKIKANVDAHNAYVETDGGWLGLRTGLSLGYRF